MPNETTLIRNARIVDGSGSPWRYGDVALAGDRITAVAPPGAIPSDSCAEVVDAAGQVVCPGFVDILSHSILSLMVDGRSLSKIAQGVTTEVMGEGWTPAPVGGRISPELPTHQFSQLLDPAWSERMRTWSRFRDWLEAMIEQGVSPNIGSFLGGGTLRKFAMGMDMRAAKADELATMARVTAEAMEDGAFGVSFALIYPPSSYADTEEVVAVAKAMRPYHGIYITHLRSEADAFLEGLEEALAVGREADVPVQVYHLKAAGTRNWHKLASAMERITEARSQGIDVTADMYSYAAAGTGLTSVLPPWAARGRQTVRESGRPGDARQDQRGSAASQRRLGGNGRSGRPARCDASRLSEGGKPALCRHAAVGDRSGDGCRLAGRGHGPAGVGGAADQLLLLCHE